MVDKAEKQISEEKETQMSKSSQLVLQIAGAALFGALSIVFAAFVTPFVPRIPGWGIAIIDPVSIIWVMCFLIFGARSGLLCCVLGTFGLMPFDPFAPIGPLMKLSATVALIIIPIMFLKLYKTKERVRNVEKIKNIRNYIVYGIFGIILRIGVMMIANYLLFLTLFANIVAFVDLSFMWLPDISGWTAIIIGVIVINAETSVWDLLIPYLIVFGLKIDEKFAIW